MFLLGLDDGSVGSIVPEVRCPARSRSLANRAFGRRRFPIFDLQVSEDRERLPFER
ncbi:uncharacterized protein METZ01_LOCUS484168, partial [marine metagenome]